MVENPHFVYEVVAMMFIASIGILIYGLTLDQAADPDPAVPADC